MIGEQDKAIRQVKFYASKCDQLDEESHKIKMNITRLKMELIAQEAREKEVERELYSYHKKLRRMVVEI